MVVDYLSKALHGSLFSEPRNLIIGLSEQNKSIFLNEYKKQFKKWYHVLFHYVCVFVLLNPLMAWMPVRYVEVCWGISFYTPSSQKWGPLNITVRSITKEPMYTLRCGFIFGSVTSKLYNAIISWGHVWSHNFC